MADFKQTAELVPGWDGNSRGWRRYTREVTWFVMGTKQSLRPFLAPRLIAKLTGPARLLAMGWNQAEFKGKDGVRMLLERLSTSPLVRRNLPNTSAIMSQYFNYKRGHNESISSYLVREALYFEEFVESLTSMKDEQDGHPRPLLPDFSDESEDDEEEQTETRSRRGYAQVPTEDPDPPPAAATSPLGGTRSHPAASPKSRAAPSMVGTPQLNEFDSFILRQLRGWRLLQGACLSAEEWRAVMASTSNRLDYGNVTAALTVLFDEQAISRQHGGHHHQQQGGPSIFSMDYDDGWEDWSSWDPSYYGYYAGWEDDYSGGHYEEDFEDTLEENEVKNDDEAAASVKGDKEAMVFFPAAAYWPVWPGQSTVSVGRTLYRSI